MALDLEGDETDWVEVAELRPGEDPDRSAGRPQENADMREQAEVERISREGSRILRQLGERDVAEERDNVRPHDQDQRG